MSAPMNQMMNNQPQNFWPQQQVPQMNGMYGMNMQQMGMQQMGMQQMPNRSQNMPTIYVGDLEEQITEEMLYNFFIKYGHIFSVRVMREQQSGSEMKKSRGFAFVSFYHQRDAENARLQANHEPILQNPIRVVLKKNMKDVNHECNVFVNNLDKSITNKDLDQFFSQFGPIFSSKVALGENGENRGYGYIQFESKEAVQKCLSESSGLMLKENKVEVEEFKRRNDRVQVRKNIYIRNLPSMSETELKPKLMDLCSKFGEVFSLMVREHKEKGKHFAFVCYEKQDAAEKAYAELQDADPFNINEKLYVNWAEKKNDRSRRLKQVNAQFNNETNIYTRNLKTDVTNESLKAAFEMFGPVTSCSVKAPPAHKKQEQTSEVQLDTLFGFINFKEKEDARKAIMQARKEPSIKELYVKESIYLNYHIKKDQYMTYKETRTRHKRFQAQQNPMANQFNMMGGNRGMMGGQMPMNMMMIPPYMMMMQNMQPPMRGNYGGMPMRGGMGGNRGGAMRGGRGGQQGMGRGGMQQRPQRYMMNNMNMQQPMQASPQQQAPQQTQFVSIQSLKDNLSEFMKLEVDQQRKILGEMLFPLIKELTSDDSLAPKITGMLIDFEVFEVSDIVDFLDSQEQLKERVQEAEELIRQSVE